MKVEERKEKEEKRRKEYVQVYTQGRRCECTG